MKTFIKKFWLPAVLVGLILSAVSCTTSESSTPVFLRDRGVSKIKMTADNFSFNPSLIKVYQGTVLTIEVSNTSSSAHNITIKDPVGQIIASKDFDAEDTVLLEANLKDVGDYEFYCDVPFHTTLGMKGRIEVIAP